MRAFLQELAFARDSRNCGPSKAPILYLEKEDGTVEEFRLPTKWGVCHVCNGAGTHVNPSIDCNGLTSEDFAEDPDFAEGYFRGDYDQTCNACQGRTTVQEVDWDRLTPEQTKAYERQLDQDARDEQERRAEIRAGA